MKIHFKKLAMIALSAILALQCTAYADNGGDNTMSDKLENCFLLDEEGGNIVYSPLSIRYALAMLADGAEGETKEEIENLLGDWEVPDYSNVDKKLSIGNAVFCKNGVKLSDEYQDKLANYQAEIQGTDFEDISAIDNWVKQKTMGMIKSSGIQKDPALRLALINALALKLSWEYPYDYFGDDYMITFYDSDGNELKVPGMSEKFHNDWDRYYTDADLTVIVKKLEQCGETNLQCTFIQPDNLEEFAKTFDGDKLQEILGKTEATSANVAGTYLKLPKFKIDYDIDLIEQLKHLGIKKAFSGEADFSAMSETEKLTVGQAKHKAYINVNEEGIEAAAMTVMMLCGSAFMQEQPVYVTIDHPFLFIISDTETGEIWFEGTVLNPLN